MPHQVWLMWPLLEGRLSLTKKVSVPLPWSCGKAAKDGAALVFHQHQGGTLVAAPVAQGLQRSCAAHIYA